MRLIQNAVRPEIDSNPQPSSLIEGRYRVIIFNDDHTPYDVVVRILMAATGCDLEEAAIETWEAHTFGRCDVHFAAEHECHEVAGVINGVGVQTDVQPEWDR
ncbi:MAG: ATP-dependent Clp protease adaptor ClpS [Fimbriimonadaceae bacterium]|nr:ATP-dependent Clp protease adaptor ClpS [Fimbriimonadaceae bacterium]